MASANGVAAIGSPIEASLLHAAAPLQGLDELGSVLEREVSTALSALPGLPADFARVAPGPATLAGPVTLQAVAVVAALVVAFLFVRRITQRARRRAGRSRSASLGLLLVSAWDVLALLVSIVVARVLLVRWLKLHAGDPILPAEAAVATVRCLIGVTIATFLFQPGLPRFRLLETDDRGARRAVGWTAGLIALGYLHSVLLTEGVRAGLPLTSAKLLSWLVALLMTAAALRLISSLKAHGLHPLPRLAAMVLIVAIFAFWAWGWVVRDFDLYYGAVRTIGVVVVALALDRAIGISIRDSRDPDTMRMLSVLRVVLDGIALALVTRIVVEFWLVGSFGLLPAAEWPAVSRRLTFASAMVVVGIALAAGIHAWTEARLVPARGDAALSGWNAHIQRLSTILPLLRVAAITLVAVVFSLVALSTLGVDVAPLMAGAGIIGLAISFGSQTLVKDIVSGVFYMLDDVFRLGETIETGGRSGEVEQINLRSVRLRDEQGRLHTIPLGELGAITNHSRALVRMELALLLPQDPDPATVARLTRFAVAALHSEPAIHTAIVGDVETGSGERAESRPAVEFSFKIGRNTAYRAEALVRRLMEDAATDAGLPAGDFELRTAITDLTPAEAAAPEKAAEDATNVA